MAQPSDHTNGEEFSGDEGLPTREETSQFQFECPDGRSVSKNQNRQTQLLWGACGQQRLCSDRLLIVALFIIVIVWVQLVGFIVLFNVSPAKNGARGRGSTAPNSTVDQNACQAEIYSGTICRSTLSRMSLSCGINKPGDSDVYISTQGGDQDDVESQVLMLSNGLQLLSPSLECEEAVLPFLCLFAFPLCDGNGRLYQPSSGECETLTTETCAREWQMAVSFLGSENLPQCDFLPVTSLQCNGSSAFNGSDSTTNTSNSTEIICSTDFYLDLEDNICKAECGKWKLYPDTLETVMVTLIIVATAVGIIGGAVVLILSCINYKTAFAFPSVFVRYEVAIMMVYDVLVLISLIGDGNVFCSSRDLFLSSQMETTHYCTFTAVVFYYTYIQVNLLWALHIGAIFWGLMFPFQARRFKVAGKNKYLHLAVILLVLFIPAIAVAGTLGPDGVEFQRYPPIICAADNTNANFYSSILPLSIADVVGCTLLVLVFWMIHKISRTGNATVQRTRTPEVKILFIICYFLGIAIFLVIIFSVSFWNSVPRIRQNLSEYLLCESIGMRPGNSCADERRSLNNGVINQLLFDIAYILLGSFPAVNLIYAVNFSYLKKKCKKTT